jgi:CubicO group peptidase (beta-lactamase class C family)
MPNDPVHGFAREPFAAARDAFEANFASGADVGACFCATLEGETVVDLWGGWADAAKTRAWERDTIVNVYSTTKTMTALTALLVADRGGIDFDAPVARYWPEFAANGKERITVAQLMSHSSGLSGWREKLAPGDIYDWEKMTALLAAQAPLWEPGTASGYHVFTHGFLIGEVVRRVTGKSLGTVFREEIAEPLGADFHIGLAAAEDHRCAELIPFTYTPPPGGPPKLSEVEMISLLNMPMAPTDVMTREWRAAEIPAVNGHGNARSVAEIHTILANGGVAKGRRFLSQAGCRKALELQVEGPDLVMKQIQVRFGMGFALTGSELLKISPPGLNTLWWGGGGGSLILIDMDARTTLAYAMNKMAPSTVGDPRSFAIVEAMWKALAA